jgi:site-specific recombinase XerD
MASLNFYIRKDKGEFKINSKGKSTLLLQYNHHSKICYFSTGVQVIPEEFNFQKEHVKLKFSKGADRTAISKTELNLNRQILSKKEFIQTKIDELIFEEIEPTIHMLRERVNEIKKKKLDHDFQICFEDFVKTKTGISKTTLRNYKTMHSTVNRFLKFRKQKTIVINEIDFRFYTLFCSWMEQEEDLAPNTLGERVKRMKAFLRHQKKQGYDVYEHLDEFAVFREPKTIIYLDMDEIQQLIAYDFSKHQKLERVRDIFIVGCHTGFRVSDLMRLTLEDITKGLFRIKTRKTGSEATPPASSFCLNVLNKYEGKLPKISKENYNIYLKEMAKKAGITALVEIKKYKKGAVYYEKHEKCDLLSSHVAVKTFITNCAFNKIDISTVVRCTGKSVKTILESYQGVDESFIKSEVSKIF